MEVEGYSRQASTPSLPPTNLEKGGWHVLKTPEAIKNNRQKVEPSPALVEFKEEYCPHLSYDDPELLYQLLEKLSGRKGGENR